MNESQAPLPLLKPVEKARPFAPEYDTALAEYDLETVD